MSKQVWGEDRWLWVVIMAILLAGIILVTMLSGCGGSYGVDMNSIDMDTNTDMNSPADMSTNADESNPVNATVDMGGYTARTADGAFHRTCCCCGPDGGSEG